MTSPPFLVVRDLTIGWDDAPPILTDVSFEIARSEVFAILGGSGSGKSTLLRSLIGIVEPRTGTIDGEGAPTLGARRPSFGVSFQGGALLGSLTVAENIALPLKRWTDLPEAAVAAVVRSKLGLVGLAGTGEKLPSELSGGMTKRASIARALALEPNILFLDEPSAGLDPPTSAGIDDLIGTLRRALGLTVILVSHELESVYAIADRCILLDSAERRIIAAGPPQALAGDPDPRVHDFFHRTNPSTRAPR